MAIGLVFLAVRRRRLANIRREEAAPRPRRRNGSHETSKKIENGRAGRPPGRSGRVWRTFREGCRQAHKREAAASPRPWRGSSAAPVIFERAAVFGARPRRRADGRAPALAPQVVLACVAGGLWTMFGRNCERCRGGQPAVRTRKLFSPDGPDAYPPDGTARRRDEYKTPEKGRRSGSIRPTGDRGGVELQPQPDRGGLEPQDSRGSPGSFRSPIWGMGRSP